MRGCLSSRLTCRSEAKFHETASEPADRHCKDRGERKRLRLTVTASFADLARLTQHMLGKVQKDPEEAWIFGFGSIIYKQGFEYQRRVDGYIKGWRRVWYQGSTDHRGTEKAPGRTVTIIPDPEGAVYGSAFLLTGDLKEQKRHMEELEHREKQYDGREHFDIYASPDDEEPLLTHVLTFVATSKNMHWLGPASVESIAQQIASCSGPSGPNHEYLEQLAQAMWKAKIKEPELYELHERVRQIRKGREHSASDTEGSTWQHISQDGIAAQ